MFYPLTDHCDKNRSNRQVNLLGTSCRNLAIAATATFAISAPANSQTVDAGLYEGGKARVNQSAKLRSLSEAVAAANCRVAAGIDADASSARLTTIASDFDKVLDGLKDGSPALGMPTAESSGRIVRRIDDVNAIWGPIGTAANNRASGSGTAQDDAAINDNYTALFEATVVLAADVSGEYSNPLELLQSDAITLNFAGRQRTLLNRMERIICGLETGTDGLGTVEELTTTVGMFEQSMVALRDGFVDAGVNPPPNDAVKNALSAAYDDWQANKTAFDAAISGAALSDDDVIAATAETQRLVLAMNNIITLYLIATPGQEGVYRVPLTAYAETELSAWLNDPILIDAINAQNAAHADLDADQIIALDQEWRAEAGAGGGALITQLLTNPASDVLRAHQANTAGFVTEVFIMDNRGLNVAQSVETSDYWQGDEAKWQETYGNEDGTLHISDVEFDDSTGFYQTQASLPIFDPNTGEKIGAVTFGINVQSLM